LNEDDPKGFLSRLFAGWNRARENPVADVALGFTPAGVAADVQDAAKAIRDRDALGVALASAGFIPGVGDVVKGVGKGLRRAASDLPMDQASRIARAREMGFDVDTPLYHGTDSSFDTFSPSSGGMLGQGAYLTDSPNMASQYAEAVTDPFSHRFIPEYERGSLAPNVMPVFARIEKPFDVAMMDHSDEYLPEMLRAAGINLPPNATKADAINELLDRGYDAVRLKDKWGGEFGFPESIVNVLDPSRIRSQFARFDPAMRESANLLAGTAGAMIGGSALARALKEENKREER